MRLGLSLHDLQVHQDLAGAGLGSQQLLPVKSTRHRSSGFMNPLLTKRGRAQRHTVPNPDGEVPAVAIHILALPEALAHGRRSAA
jgi:hypothetical protein